MEQFNLIKTCVILLLSPIETGSNVQSSNLKSFTSKIISIIESKA